VRLHSPRDERVVIVTQAEFVVSAVSPQDFPRDGIPEVVLAGRSNVGKSSLINRLVGQRKLARTSATPGKTQSINFYRLNGSFFFVDLPGYGYAKASKESSRKWRRLVEQYFQNRRTIVMVIQLVDSRIPPTHLDLELAEWLDALHLPRMIVATKVDKLSGNEKTVQLRTLSSAFSGAPVTPASALTGTGCKEIWKRVEETTSSKEQA
jgi:GTP-binding protein